MARRHGPLTTQEPGSPKWQEWLTGFEYALDPAGNRIAVTETTSALLAYQLPALGETAHSPPAPPLEPSPEGATAEQVEVIEYGYRCDGLSSGVGCNWLARAPGRV